MMNGAPRPGYIRFVGDNRGMLAFGFLMAFGSSFGQTFFIGVFGPGIESTFGLTHAGWGSIYMAGTMLSAALLPFTTRLIDRIELRPYALLVCGALITATAAAALTPAAWCLIPVVFLLRHSGQGLASHTAVTSMVKHFRRNRGKALAVAILGFPAGRAILPFAAVAMMAVIGWRWTFALCALALSLLLLPAVAALLARDTRLSGEGDGKASARPNGSAAPDRTPGDRTPGDRTLGQALRSPFFYMILPGILAPSFFETALFFHQLTVAGLKSWSPVWVTGGYAVFALMATAVSLIVGPLIDRVGAVRLLPFVLIPFAMGVLALGFGGGAGWAWIYLGLSGVGSGAMATVLPNMLVEVFGVRHIGAIRGLVITLGVFASALGPPALGVAIDAGARLDVLSAGAATYLVAASALIWLARRMRGRLPQETRANPRPLREKGD